MKKIKITESQAKSLGLINENFNPLVLFEHFCRSKIRELNKMYTNIIMISTGDVLDNPNILIPFSKELDKIETELMNENKTVTNYVNSANVEGLDLRAEGVYSSVNNPLEALGIILASLENIARHSGDIKKHFTSTNPLDITSRQS